jgi:hypothetical protein
MLVTEAPARESDEPTTRELIAPARLHHASAPLLPPDYSSPTGMWDLHIRAPPIAMLNRLIDLGAATKPALRGRCRSRSRGLDRF